jgi:signal transduction histidine kinase
LFIGKNNRVFPVEFSKNTISIENQEYFLCSLRDISDRKENEKRMLNAVITAEENERKRIAENIHDDIGPFLSGIMMYVREIISPNTKQKQKEYLIDYLNDMLDKTIEKTRNISHNLMPTILTDFGIIKAVNDFCNQINKLNQVKIVFRHSNNFRIDEIYEISIYRIITELVNNSLKHSNAKNIFIDIKKTKTKITINFRDDGIGFALNQRIKKTTGLGLRNVLSRLDSIHGTYSFKSKKNEGIQFYFTINLKETI